MNVIRAVVAGMLCLCAGCQQNLEHHFNTSVQATSASLVGTVNRVAQDNLVAVANPAGDAQMQQMLDLARKSGCLACHAVDRKVVGPAWRQVAQRYKGDKQANTKLVESVSKGSKGKWPEARGVPMPPYSPRVPMKDIEQLVTFILSLE